MTVPTILLPESIKTSPLADLAAAYKERMAVLQQAQGEYEALTAQTDTAEAKDREALADAIAAGKADPGAVHVEQHTADLAKAARYVAADVDLAQRAHDDLVAALAGSLGVKWRTDAENAAETSWDKCAGTVEKAIGTIRNAVDAMKVAEAVLGDAERLTKPEATIPRPGYDPAALDAALDVISHLPEPVPVPDVPIASALANAIVSGATVNGHFEWLRAALYQQTGEVPPTQPRDVLLFMETRLMQAQGVALRTGEVSVTEADREAVDPNQMAEAA